MLTELTAPKNGTDLTNRDFSWFAKKVEKGRDGIFTEIVAITPAIAKRLLEQNEDNRKPKNRIILAIAKDIINNHWELNGETIKVSKEGWLNDGQNRLLAIIKADRAVETLVTFGLERHSRLTVDMGASRSSADFLGMIGTANANNIAAISRLDLVFQTGVATRRGGISFTRQDVINHFMMNKDEMLMAYKETGNNTKFAKLVHGGSFLPVAYMHIKSNSSQGCQEFFSNLREGANLDIHDPVLWLRARLLESTNEWAEQRLEIVLRHWNAWAKDEKVKRKITLQGRYPKILVV